MADEIKIPVEFLTETKQAMGQLKSELDALKKGQITDEAFMAKGTQLVETMLAEHDKKTVAEAERRAIFPTANIDGDPRAFALKAAFMERNSEDRMAKISQAFKMPTDVKALEQIKEAHDNLAIVHAGIAARYPGSYRGVESLRAYQRFVELRDRVSKYMDLTDTANWVPTGESAMLLEVPDLTGAVENLFEHVTMPTSPYNYPVKLNGPTSLGYHVDEATAHVNPTTDPGAQALTDGLFTWTARKVRGRCVMSGEINEDAIIAMVPAIKQELAQVTARSVETCDINGDRTGYAGTHMDYDVSVLDAALTAPNHDPRVMWDGLRHGGMHASLYVALTTWALATLRSMRGKLGAYGVNPLELAWLFTIKDYLRYIVTNDDVRTQNVYGPRATVFTGQLEQLDGSPIIVSPHMPTNLHTTGYNVTGQANTAGCALLVNKKYWKHGDRRLFTIEAERILDSDQLKFVSFRRLDFQPFQAPDGTYSSVSCGYNIVA